MLRGSGAPVPLSPAQAQMVKHLAVECIWSFMMVDAALNKQFYTRETEAALIKACCEGYASSHLVKCGQLLSKLCFLSLIPRCQAMSA